MNYYDPEGHKKENCPIEAAKKAISNFGKKVSGKTKIEIKGELEYVHYLKQNKVTDINDLQKQVQDQIDGFNRIISEEGMSGLKSRIRAYGPEVEAEGRKYVKTLEPAPSGKAHLHVPDMKTGGAPTDVLGIGDRRNNSIIGGQADQIAREILNMGDNVTKIIGKLTLIGGKK